VGWRLQRCEAEVVHELILAREVRPVVFRGLSVRVGLPDELLCACVCV
jgi:hypothetical protein